MDKDCVFSTQINIRQNDVGQNCKSALVSMRKIVILPSCILQFVRKTDEKCEAKCGKPCGNCGIPQPKGALKQDF